jgi:primosomal protein N' (replication factor Y)
VQNVCVRAISLGPAEIALTANFDTVEEARFGCKPAEWHSGVTMTERRRCWRMVGQGDAQLIVGARSALFYRFAIWGWSS